METNFEKKEILYDTNEYTGTSSELCRGNENEYGRTDYEEEARKELISRSPGKNVMSSNTGNDTEKIKSADSIILKLSNREIKNLEETRPGEPGGKS